MTAGTTSRRRPLSRWLIVLIFVLSLPAVTTRINASDEIQFFAWLPSWMFDHDVDFENEYRHFHDAGPGRYPGFVATFLEDTNEAGRRPNFAPIGSALLWMPFYGVGHLAAGLSGAPTDGLSQPYIAAVTYGSAIYGMLALVLSASIASQLFGRWGTGPAFLVWVGTPLVFYMYIAPAFAHATSAFAVALFLWVWLRVRDRWTMPGVVALALSAALLPMVREQDAFFVAGPALDFLRSVWLQTRNLSTDLRRRLLSRYLVTGVVGIVVALVAYAPQLAAYQALNGHPGPTDKVARKMTWTSPHFAEVLFSPQHGFFFWTPLALVALVGLVSLVVRQRPTREASVPGAGLHPDIRWIALLLLLMAFLQAWVSGSVESWTVAGAFGQRRFVALTPVLAVGIAALWPAIRQRALRWAAATLAVLLVWWNVGLMAQFGLHLMDRQRLSLLENARTTFLTLPRLAPSIVLRYFTDRESFYGRPRE